MTKHTKNNFKEHSLNANNHEKKSHHSASNHQGKQQQHHSMDKEEVEHNEHTTRACVGRECDEQRSNHNDYEDSVQ